MRKLEGGGNGLQGVRGVTGWGRRKKRGEGNGYREGGEGKRRRGQAEQRWYWGFSRERVHGRGREGEHSSFI